MKFKSVSTIVLSAVMMTGFCQCSQQPANNTASQENAPVAVSGLKIAYIDVDSLLANFTFAQDLMEELTRKEENYRLVLTEEANKLDKEAQDFQKKVQNGVYSSRERAESEQNRLLKKQQALQEKSDKYSLELLNEREANSQKISETVENHVKEYNKTHGFNLIISKNSLLYADEGLNITADILDGLNAEYKSTAE